MSKRILGDLGPEVLALAEREDRSLASMVRVLIREALEAREASRIKREDYAKANGWVGFEGLSDDLEGPGRP